ncbi:MAG: hypothetical protein MJ213_00010 [Bacilli bacterium]|nr:hypothetical protein [Bacilli bacterium]
MDLSIFVSLADLFKKHGYCLYLTGGSARDYLLKRDFVDFDLTTDATPSEMKEFLPEMDYTYAKFGNVHSKHLDITTLRVEGDYKDYRHPSVVRFTTKLEEDYLRRDFTINALYIDSNLKVYDYCHGLDDLKNKIIRFIGDPNKRVQEDPLRILRAERFANKLGFIIESNSLKAMNSHKRLLEKLNSNKIKEEIKKHNF